MKKAFISVLVGTVASMAGAFQVPTRATRASTSTRQYATIQPTESSTIGTVGNGYLPIILAKLSALTHGNAWVICPAADMEMMKQLAAVDGSGELPNNLEFVPASDTDRVETLLRDTDALLVACDDVDSVVDPNVINYLLDPEKVNNLQRVVAMSRNLMELEWACLCLHQGELQMHKFGITATLLPIDHSNKTLRMLHKSVELIGL